MYISEHEKQSFLVYISLDALYLCAYCISLITGCEEYRLLKCNCFLMQLSFQMWTNQMQDTLNSKKKGDMAFRHKDFRVATDCYTVVRTSVSLLVVIIQPFSILFLEGEFLKIPQEIFYIYGILVFSN